MIKHNSTLVVSNREPGIISEFNSQNFGKKEVDEIKLKLSDNIHSEKLKENSEIPKTRHKIGSEYNKLDLLQDSPRTATNLIIK